VARDAEALADIDRGEMGLQVEEKSELRWSEDRESSGVRLGSSKEVSQLSELVIQGPQWGCYPPSSPMVVARSTASRRDDTPSLR
jgi:hypothetical protein